jgi:NADH-quinone oxidoreductase subunit L
MGHDHHEVHHAVHDQASHSHGEDPHGFFYTDEEWEKLQAAKHEEHHHALGPDHTPHEVSWLMWAPLAVLAVFSLGWIGGGWLDHNETFLKWLYPNAEGGGHEGPVSHIVLIIASTVTSLGGIAIGWWIWAKKLPVWEGFDLAKWNPVQRWAGRQWGIDEVLTDGTVRVSGRLGTVFNWIDKWVVDGLVNLVGIIAKLFGGGIRKSQTGYVRGYALLMQIGAVAFIGYLLYAMVTGASK